MSVDSLDRTLPDFVSALEGKVVFDDPHQFRTGIGTTAEIIRYVDRVLEKIDIATIHSHWQTSGLVLCFQSAEDKTMFAFAYQGPAAGAQFG